MAGDGTTRNEIKLGTTHGVINALCLTLFLSQPCTGDFRHAVNGRNGGGINRAFERDTQRVAGGRPALLHRDGCEGGAEHVPGCEDIVGRGSEIFIDHDSATRVDLYARGIQAQPFRVGGAPAGKKNRVRL